MWRNMTYVEKHDVEKDDVEKDESEALSASDATDLDLLLDGLPPKLNKKFKYVKNIFKNWPNGRVGYECRRPEHPSPPQVLEGRQGSAAA